MKIIINKLYYQLLLRDWACWRRYVCKCSTGWCHDIEGKYININ